MSYSSVAVEEGIQTVVVDDKESFIDLIAEWTRTRNKAGVAFFTSLNDARKRLAEVRGEIRKPIRYIVDYVFEGEDDDGLSFLENVKSLQPTAEVILLTGKVVTQGMETRIRQLGGSLLPKGALNFRLLERLFSADPFEQPRIESGAGADIGELSLKLEAIEGKFANLRQLNDLLVDDIISELDQVKDKKVKALQIGNKQLSVEELKGEVRGKTAVGLELMRLHHELFRRLRRRIQ